MSEAEVSRNYALEKQVKPEDILIESKSRTTEDNLRYAYDVAKQNDLKTYTIVSDPYHMKRAIVIAEDLGMEVYSSPTPSTVFRSFKTKWSFFWQEWYYYIDYQISRST